MNRLDSLREVLDCRFAELQQEIDSLKEENYKLRNGFQGACYACEPVGELNQKLTDAGHALYHALGYFTDNFDYMNDRDYLFTAEKAAVNRWRELFNNNIPEQNYED
jgi:hypothetical protein